MKTPTIDSRNGTQPWTGLPAPAPAGDASRVEVAVVVDATSVEDGQEYFERSEFEASQEGGEVRIRSRDPQMGSSWWRTNRRARAVVVVRHPPEMSMRVASGDGDVEAGVLSGEIHLCSGDGEIRVRRR